MNKLSELDFQEQEDYALEEPAPARRSHVRRTSRGWLIFPAAVSIAALVTAITALLLVLRKDEEPPPDPPAEEEPATFRFGDRVLTPIEGMPVNSFDKNAFGVDEKGRVTYELDGRRAKTGVDVSSHQQDIDWAAAAADGIEFAILRLGRRGYTEGGLFLDQTFEQNLSGALDAGLEVGVYFFSQAITPEEAEEEAEYVLEALGGQELALPIAFDWEPISEEEARTDGLDGAAMTRCAAAFCERVQEAGYRPAVYFNRTQGYLRYDLYQLKEYNLWLAEYGIVPDFYYHFDLWQYSDAGQVDGIQGAVDLDLAF